MIEDQEKFIAARKRRNIALARTLVAFIVILYLVTIFKMGAALFI